MTKVLVLLGILSSLALASDTSIFEHKTEKPEPADNKEMCKLFTEKAAAYEATMRHDEYAEATLQSYKDRAAIYCNKKK